MRCIEERERLLYSDAVDNLLQMMRGAMLNVFTRELETSKCKEGRSERERKRDECESRAASESSGSEKREKLLLKRRGRAGEGRSAPVALDERRETLDTASVEYSGGR